MPLNPDDCLDFDYLNRGPCEGPVENRPSLTGTGTPIPRCERHWAMRLEQEQEWREVYPDSPNPPSWFDPLNAGEHWDSDY